MSARDNGLAVAVRHLGQEHITRVPLDQGNDGAVRRGAQLSQVSPWPDVLQGRILALACAAINTLSQIGAFFLPILWGRLADSTGSFRVGLVGLTAATAITLLLILELSAHVRRTMAHA